MSVFERARKSEEDAERERGDPVDPMVATWDELNTAGYRHERANDDPRATGENSRRAVGAAAHHERASIEQFPQFVRWARRLGRAAAHQLSETAAEGPHRVRS